MVTSRRYAELRVSKGDLAQLIFAALESPNRTVGLKLYTAVDMDSGVVIEEDSVMGSYTMVTFHIKNIDSLVEGADEGPAIPRCSGAGLDRRHRDHRARHEGQEG